MNRGPRRTGLLAIVLLFSLATPVPKSRTRANETALEILQRRYARGEIDTTEYEERKARLASDQASRTE
jgi:uncharacterized membrane protein